MTERYISGHKLKIYREHGFIMDTEFTVFSSTTLNACLSVANYKLIDFLKHAKNQQGSNNET